MAYPTLAQYNVQLISQPAGDIVGSPGAMGIDSVAKAALGTTALGQDIGSLQYGFVTLIYLKGVASNAAGALVTYTPDGTVTLSTSGIIGNCAVSLAANTSASTFSWYVVVGATPVASASLGSSPPTKLDTGAGAAALRATGVKGINGLLATANQDTPTSGFTKCVAAWPSASGFSSP